MSFEIKNAVKEWKKVKPLLLTKTGVSEALRILNDWDPKKITSVKQATEWQEKINKMLKTIDTVKKQDRVKKHAKVFAFLDKELPYEIMRSTQFLGLAKEGEVIYDEVDKKWYAKSVAEKKQKERRQKAIVSKGLGNQAVTSELKKKFTK